MNDSCTNPEIGKYLHAYELNLLSEEEKDRFETHILECNFCYNEVKSFSPRGVLMTGSEEIKKELEKELHRDSEKNSLWSHLWPDKPLIFRPAVLFILIALMIWPAMVGIRTISGGGREAGIATVQKVFLSSLRSNGATTFRIDKNLDGLLVINCPGIEINKTYELKISDSGGNTLFQDVHFDGFDMFRNAEIKFPHDLMRPGEYSVVISDISVQPAVEICRYDFWIE